MVDTHPKRWLCMLCSPTTIEQMSNFICYTKLMRMLCRYRNHDGIEIRAEDFGGLGGINALHPGLPRLTPMFSKLTNAFKDEGYQERKHLFGAPYDFRLAADGLEQVPLEAVHLL